MSKGGYFHMSRLTRLQRCSIIFLLEKQNVYCIVLYCIVYWPYQKDMKIPIQHKRIKNRNIGKLFSVSYWMNLLLFCIFLTAIFMLENYMNTAYIFIFHG